MAHLSQEGEMGLDLIAAAGKLLWDPDVRCPSWVVTIISSAIVRMCYFSHLTLTSQRDGTNYGHPLFS